MEDIIKILVIIILTILFGICIYVTILERQNYEDYGEKYGLIVDRKYIPPITRTKEVNNITVPYIEQAKYQFKIQKEENGEIKSIWIYVTEAEYNIYKIEDYYGISEN